jgi:hypothetical protein
VYKTKEEEAAEEKELVSYHETPEITDKTELEWNYSPISLPITILGEYVILNAIAIILYLSALKVEKLEIIPANLSPFLFWFLV